MFKYFQKGTVILNKPNKKTRKNRILRVIVFFSEPELKTKEVQNVVLPSFWNFWDMFFYKLYYCAFDPLKRYFVGLFIVKLLTFHSLET